MTDDLLTEFRTGVPLPDETTARRAYERATHSHPTLVTRRRLVIAAAVVGVAGIAGGLGATFVGASSNVNPERQQIVNRAAAQVRQAFGDHRIAKATLDGSLLTVDVPGHGPLQGTVGGLEGLVLAHVAENELQAAGDEGIDNVDVGGGGGPLSPFPAQAQLPADACDIPAGLQLADTTAASGRVIPLLGGFCSFRLTTAHPRLFDAETILNQLRAAVPASDQGGTHHRAQVFEVYGENGKPVIIVAWAGGTNEGGSEYVHPGSSGLPTP
jgi:hypothetical protein